MPKFTPPFVRSAYNYDPATGNDDCVVTEFGPSLTQQSQAEEADINTIVKRFGLGGTVPLNPRLPILADFEGIFDYKTAMDAVTSARTRFMDMPADIRQEFSNDPQLFVEFCSNKDNLPALRKLGLAPEEAPPSTDEPPPGNSAPKPSGSVPSSTPS